MPLILPIELKVTPAVRGLVHSEPPISPIESQSRRRRNRRSFFLSSVFLYNHYVLLTSLARTAFPSIIKSISKPRELISPGTAETKFYYDSKRTPVFGCQAPFRSFKNYGRGNSHVGEGEDSFADVIPAGCWEMYGQRIGVKTTCIDVTDQPFVTHGLRTAPAMSNRAAT